MILQIDSSAYYWWLFFLHASYSFLLTTRIVSLTTFLVLFFQELAVAHCLSTEMINSGSLQSQQLQTMSFLAVDIYAKLVFSILKVVNCISFSFLIFFLGIFSILAVLLVSGTGIKQTLSSFQGVL